MQNSLYFTYNKVWRFTVQATSITVIEYITIFILQCSLLTRVNIKGLVNISTLYAWFGFLKKFYTQFVLLTLLNIRLFVINSSYY